MDSKAGVLEDTIVALSTPPGEGGIGIVRLSGPRSVAIADTIFVPKNGRPLSAVRTHSLVYGWVVKQSCRQAVAGGNENPPFIPLFQRGKEGDFWVEDKNQTAKGAEGVIDEVLVSVMRAPRTYTCQDVVEINAHAGIKVLSLILELLIEKGARPAQPGEFTRRAFLNGRMDLAQAEAVLDIIRAKGDLALSAGLSALSGGVSRDIRELRVFLLDILARIEGAIDFPQEEIAPAAAGELSSKIYAVGQKIKKILDFSRQARVIRDGLKVVIYGRPNVGKSSLLNALLKEERAIVTALPGTTRDTIEECVNIQGLTVRLVDTAGILAAANEIEEQALARTAKAVVCADVIIFVLDATSTLTREDRRLACAIADRQKIVVINKSDQPTCIDKEEVRVLAGSALEISAKTGYNLGALEEAIVKMVFDGQTVFAEGTLAANTRHIDIFKRALQCLEEASASLSAGLSLEFVSLDVRGAVDTLGEITGESVNGELLDTIFSKFCIGK